MDVCESLLTRIEQLSAENQQLQRHARQQVKVVDQQQASLARQRTTITRQEATIQKQLAKIAKLEQEKERLARDYVLLAQKLFRKRGEKYTLDPRQLLLDLGGGADAENVVEGLEDAVRDQQGETEEAASRRPAKRRRPRGDKNLPEHLPRYEVVVKVRPPCCPVHGEQQPIGYDVVERLELERPKLRVRVQKYPKFACANHPECGVNSPPRPQGLVEGDCYDTSIAAEIITSKRGYHLPIYRQQDLFAGVGWIPSRSTLLNIERAAAVLIAPLIAFFATLVRQDKVLATDDTTVTLLLPKEVPGEGVDEPFWNRRAREVIGKALEQGKGSVTAYLWAYRGTTVPLNVFDFTVSRHRDGPEAFLLEQNYRGTLLGDAYSGYKGISLSSNEAIVLAACHAHARRKVYEARENHPKHAAVLLGLFQELYDIEDRGRNLSPDERLALRQAEAVPVWDRLEQYLASDSIANVFPKEAMGEAITYLRKQRDALRVYLSDPLVPIDNNATEQLMKQIAVGRKNWLFIGSLAAGKRSADLMTLVSSALRNDLDPWEYTKGVLDALLAGAKTASDFERLRPDTWAAEHPEHIRTYRQEERRDRADRKQLHREQRRQARKS